MVKKIIKILIKIFVISITAILVALLIARKIFPPEKLKALVISEVEAAINRHVTVGDVWFNPFKGISIENIVVFERTDSSQTCNDSTKFFTVEQALLKYRFLSLLKKEISIAKIIVDNPFLTMVQQENLAWNFDDLLVSDTTAVADTTTEEFILPVSLDLKEFTIKNLSVRLLSNQPEMKLALNTGGITIIVFGLFLPKNSSEKINTESRLTLKVTSNDEP